MIRLIAATDEKRGLAKEGQIPWHISKDIKRFKDLTMTFGANVLAGRATYELMPHLIKGRHFFVVSHQDLELPDDHHLVKDLDMFLANFKDDLWVIGGQKIYEETIKYADELYLTQVKGDYHCDKFFPDYNDFKLTTSDGPYSENQLSFTFQYFKR